MYNRPDNVWRQECRVDHLQNAALREVLAGCNVLESLTLLDRFVVLMSLGDASDHRGINSFW